MADTGFAATGKTDPGWYGGGIYLTNDSKYALEYCKTGPKWLVLTAATPGNIYPVTELNSSTDTTPGLASLKGKACEPGYQSHITYVPKGNLPHAHPVTAPTAIDSQLHAVEVVLFEGGQVLPLFIFCMK